MNVYYCTPFSIERNLGKAYNEYVNKLTQHEDDWVFFVDGDVMFLTPDWGKQIYNMIQKYPETGIFTAITNRVGNLEQCYLKTRSKNSDILDHQKTANILKQNYYYDVKEIDRVISGHMFGFSRKTWMQVGGFTENEGEILKVDNRFSSRVLKSGKKILLMQGLYVLHYYRLHEFDSKHANQHLK